MEDLYAIAEQLHNVIATSDLIPGLEADIDPDMGQDGNSVWFPARLESGEPVRVTLTRGN